MLLWAQERRNATERRATGCRAASRRRGCVQGSAGNGAVLPIEKTGQAIFVARVLQSAFEALAGCYRSPFKLLATWSGNVDEN
jgi:hypothetical protein